MKKKLLNMNIKEENETKEMKDLRMLQRMLNVSKNVFLLIVTRVLALQI